MRGLRLMYFIFLMSACRGFYQGKRALSGGFSDVYHLETKLDPAQYRAPVAPEAAPPATAALASAPSVPARLAVPPAAPPAPAPRAAASPAPAPPAVAAPTSPLLTKPLLKSQQAAQPTVVQAAVPPLPTPAQPGLLAGKNPKATPLMSPSSTPATSCPGCPVCPSCISSRSITPLPAGHSISRPLKILLCFVCYLQEKQLMPKSQIIEYICKTMRDPSQLEKSLSLIDKVPGILYNSVTHEFSEPPMSRSTNNNFCSSFNEEH